MLMALDISYFDTTLLLKSTENVYTAIEPRSNKLNFCSYAGLYIYGLQSGVLAGARPRFPNCGNGLKCIYTLRY